MPYKNIVTMEEFSAGGVVFKHEDGKVLILVSQHSGHHGWVFPKGHVGDKEKDETAEDAALREVAEETGVSGKILEKLPVATYWYQFQGEKRHKTVQYFLMAYEDGSIEHHDFEMENVLWLPLDEVEAKLTYEGDKKVWGEAKKLILNKYKE